MGISVKGKSQDIISWSEFGVGSNENVGVVYRQGVDSAYDRSVVTGTIKKLLCEGRSVLSKPDYSTHGFELIVSCDDGQDSDYDGLCDIKYIDCEEGFVAVDEYINCLIMLSLNLYDGIMLFSDINASISVLDAFFDLSKNVVFNYQSELLYNMSFRKSNFLDKLMLFGSHRIELSNDNINNEKENGAERPSNSIVSYSFGFKNPFVIDSFRRILNNIQEFNIRNVDSNLLTILKHEILLRRAERSLNRFLRAENKTHRVSLNRHTSELTSWPYYELSSIEEIKPIRLFEKIVTYINNNIDFDIGEFCVNISIVGHTEVSNNGKEKELADLMIGILSWYEQFVIKKPTNTKLILNIDNYVNEKDWPNYNSKRIKNFEYENKYGKAECSINLVDYSSYFALSLFEMSKIIEKSDVVFILDCPWLTSEDVNVKKQSSLDYFCRAIKDVELINSRSLEDYSYKNPERLDSQYNTLMKYLDSQYNRIMASSTLNAGSIVRILKEKVIKRMQQMVSCTDSSVKKELYIFSSENDGLDYSYLASYPLARIEMYEGKRISIFQLCNYKPNLLEFINRDNLVFNIRLWSMLKYISIAYAYIDFKNVIDECFRGVELSPEYYFSLYRSIYVTLLIDVSMCNIDVSINLDENIKSVFTDSFDDVFVESCLRKLVRKIGFFVKDIYKEVIFSSDDDFGNNAIREAFSMNVYSCASDVNGMMFWHKYRMAMLNNSFSHFNINYCLDDDINVIDAVDYDKDIFMDKKVYDLVLLSLETQNSFSPVIKSMIHSCEEVFGVSDMVQRVIQNIVDICEKIGVEAEELKWNAMDSLRELF